MQLLFIKLLGLISLVVFFGIQAIDFEALSYDDQMYVFDNPKVLSGLSIDNTKWALTETGGTNLWHPLTWMSHQLDVTLWGPDAKSHHAVNLLLHGLNTVVVFFLLLKITTSKWLSLFIAALFAVHPHAAEVVGWISERKELLSSLFGLSCLLSWTHSLETNKKQYYWLSLTLMFLACLSKPSMVVIPGALIMLSFWHGHKLGTKTDYKTLLIRILPFCILACACAYIAISVQASGDFGRLAGQLPLSKRIAFLPHVIGHYLASTFSPNDLKLFNLYPTTTPSLWWSIILWGGGVAVIALCHRLKLHLPLFGIGWFLCFLLPVMGFIPVSEHYVASRYAYIPQIGLFIAAAGIIHHFLLKKNNATLFNLAKLASVASILLLTILGHRQLSYWKDGITLFSHEVKLTPKDQKAWIQLGISLGSKNHINESIQAFRTAATLPGNKYAAHTNLALQLYKQGDLKSAAASFEIATQANQIDSSLAHRMLANIHFKQKRIDQGIKTLREALLLFPNDPAMISDLATALGLIKHQYKESIDLFKKARILDPNSTLIQANEAKVIRKMKAAHR